MRLFELDRTAQLFELDRTAQVVGGERMLRMVSILRIYAEDTTTRAKKHRLITLVGDDDADCFRQVAKLRERGWSFERMAEEVPA